MNQFAEALAVIVWGVLAVALLFVLGLSTDAFWGAALAVLAAGVTWLYQATMYAMDKETLAEQPRYLLVLFVAPVLLGILSFVLSCFGV